MDAIAGDVVQDYRGVACRLPIILQSHDPVGQTAAAFLIGIVDVEVAVDGKVRVNGHSQQPALSLRGHLLDDEIRRVLKFTVDDDADVALLLCNEDPAVRGEGQGPGRLKLLGYQLRHRLYALRVGRRRWRWSDRRSRRVGQSRIRRGLGRRRRCVRSDAPQDDNE